MRVEEERDARDELVNVQTCVYAPLNVLDAVAQCEGEFLKRGRAGLAYVVAAHGNRVVLRDVARAELEGVNDEFHRGADRVNPLLLRDVLLEYIVLERAGNFSEVCALLLCDHQIHRQEDGRGRVYSLRDRHLFERDAVEENFHVRERRDGDSALADFTF